MTSGSDKLEVCQLQFGYSRPCCLGAGVLSDCDDSDEFTREPLDQASEELVCSLPVLDAVQSDLGG